jgi:hypothetical protein
MISFLAQGGLGNQLFQYATARSIAEQLNVELVLDPYWFSHPRADETPRSLELNRYKIQFRLATTAEQQRRRWLRSRVGRCIGLLSPIKVCRERSLKYDPSLKLSSTNSYLVGFWQSEEYFKDIRQILLSELTPLQPPGRQDYELIERMATTNAVSVHVRRGDYVSSASASSFHGVCSLDYYRAALAHITSKLETPELFIFSDDPEWTQRNLDTGGYRAHYVNHNSPVEAFQDLRLMTFCKHHIIANSSFSWWGAWLSTHDNQIVVAPRQWFQGGREAPDLIPSRWIRL